MTAIRVESFLADEGSVLVFQGVEVDTDRVVTFAADHRPGADIVDALERDDDDIVADVPEWAILSEVS